MTTEDSPADSPAEAAAVAHLIELGYEDPHDEIARRLSAQRQLNAELARAQERLDAGQLSESIEALEALCRAAPQWPPPRQLLAIACYHAGHLSRALESLDWLEFHAIEHAQLALLRATIELSRRRLDAALDQADYARHLGKSLPGPEVVIGEVHLRRGDLNAAEAAFQRAWELDGGNAGAASGLAAVALRRGNYEAAMDLALHALELNPELPVAHYRLGAALALQRMYPESRVALETFARLTPQKSAPYRWLALVCAAMADEHKAIEYREQGRRVILQRRARRGLKAS